MKLTTKKLALCAVLTALALGLSTLENLFPVSLVVPLPGIKLGLANIVTVFALYQLGAAPALGILVARCLLGSLFAGNASALLFSLMGGVGAMLVMIALRRVRGLSVYGVSIAGAAAHNIGQIGARHDRIGRHGSAGVFAGAAGSVPAYGDADRLCGRPSVPSYEKYTFCPVIPRYSGGRSDCGNPFFHLFGDTGSAKPVCAPAPQ